VSWIRIARHTAAGMLLAGRPKPPVPDALYCKWWQMSGRPCPRLTTVNAGSGRGTGLATT